jgi:hypothetical protein
MLSKKNRFNVILATLWIGQQLSPDSTLSYFLHLVKMLGIWGRKGFVISLGLAVAFVAVTAPGT